MFPFQDDIPLRRAPLVTYALILLNAVVLLLTSRVAEPQRERDLYRLGFVPARVEQFFHGRPLEVEVPGVVDVPFFGPVPVRGRISLPPDRAEIVLSAFTSMFMHGNFLHLLSNMWFLWLFGDNVEDRLGRARFLTFYLLGGCAATAFHWLHDPQSTLPVVGASGAVAAVLGAFVVTWPRARIRTLVLLVIFITIIEVPALFFLGFWFLKQLLEALQPRQFGMGESVAWWAHVGGFAAGAAAMHFLSLHDSRVTDDLPDSNSFPFDRGI